MTNRQHWISKGELTKTKWVTAQDAPLAEGHIRLSVDAFAITANNVTYAAFGDAPMHYWNFFPTSDNAWGRVPVWGFATVAQSNVDGVDPGKRVYGYFPISDTLDVEAVRVSPAGFMDGAAHRAELAPIYNTYFFTDTDPAYAADFEPQQMLFRPLYATGWWLADTLVDAVKTPPKAAVLSSASSKTACALAHGLKSRGGVKTIGLTSQRNTAFVERTGLYDEVVTYDGVATLESADPTAFVDFLGSPEMTLAVHTALGDALTRSLVVGATDWDADRTPLPLPGPTPEFFFVPDVAAARVKEAGPSLMAKMAEDLMAFYPASQAFVEPVLSKGTDAIDTVWSDSVAGTVPADKGHVVSL